MSVLEQDKAERERLEAMMAGECSLRWKKRVRNQSQKDRLETLEAKLEEVTLERDVLRNHVNGYKKSNQLLSEQAKILRNDKSDLTKHLRVVEEHEAHLERSKVAAEKREAILKKEKNTATSDAVNLSRENEELKRENNHLYGKLQAAAQRTAALDAQVTQLEERVEELTEVSKGADPALSPFEIARRTKHMAEVIQQALAVGPYMFVCGFVILMKLGNGGTREYNGRRGEILLGGLGDSHIDRVFEMMKDWDILNLRKRHDGTLSIEAGFGESLPADVMEATFGEEFVLIKI